MIDLQPVKGTRDFYPPQLRLRNWLFGIWREASLRSGFEEYDACVLEQEELYVRKAGDEISQQLYNFPDKSGRSLSLRPEMTPSLARLVLQQQKALTYPLRWFSIPQCFRYERMTRGRKREHYQWNLDIIGEPSALGELELLGTLLMTFRLMGLQAEEICLFINDRRILNALLEQLKIATDLQQAVLVVLDKRDKLPEAVFRQELTGLGLSEDQVDQLVAFLQLPDLNSVAERLKDQSVLQELQSILKGLEQLGFAEFVRFDISIVRGLSYYTGTVFEVNVPDKSFRAICGGGRYDSLLSTYGGPPVPAVGLGFGDVVILELLADLKKLPSLHQELDLIVFALDATHNPIALKISQELRAEGMRVLTEFGSIKMKRALQRAEQLQVPRAIFCFPDELSRGELVVRDLLQREQKTVAQSGLREHLLGLGDVQ